MCGTGKRGFAGNGGPAAMATLDLPVAIVFDAAGNLLIADQANQMIRRVDRATDVITDDRRHRAAAPTRSTPTRA